MSKAVKRGYKPNYTSEDMEKAIIAVRDQGMNFKHAGKLYNIPSGSLYDKIIKKSILSIEESNVIVDWITKISKAGFPISKDQVIRSVLRLVKDLNRNNQIAGYNPGNRYFYSFFKRQPFVVEKMAQAETSSRAKLTKYQLKKWFMDVKNYIEEEGLSSVFEDGRRIFNADEIAFFLYPKNNTVMARKGKKINYSQTCEEERESLTVLMTVNAAGQFVPPMVHLTCSKVPTAFNTHLPIGWSIGLTNSGWVTEDTFFEYITDFFHPWLVKQNIPLPVILFINSHSPYVTHHLSEFCAANSIELVAYPNANYVLQPMDIGVFHPLKSVWKMAVQNWQKSEKCLILREEHFSSLLNKVLKATIKKETIINGFKETGLRDLDFNKVNYAKLLNIQKFYSKVSSVKNVEYIGLDKVRKLEQQGISIDSKDGCNLKDDLLLTNSDEGIHTDLLQEQAVEIERTCELGSLDKHPVLNLIEMEQTALSLHSLEAIDEEVDVTFKLHVNQIENIMPKKQATKSFIDQINCLASPPSKKRLYLPQSSNQEPSKKSRSRRTPEVMTASFYKLYLEKKNHMEYNNLGGKKDSQC